MTYDDTSGTWHPNMTDNHVLIGAFDYSNHNWGWFDETPFDYSNWVNNTSIYSSGVDEPNGAILPDFEPMPGGWNNIGDLDEARAGVCAYDPCSPQPQSRAGASKHNRGAATEQR